MAYCVPLADILFTMNSAAGLARGIANGLYADLGDGLAEATLNEASKFAESVLAPLNRVGDQVGAKWHDGVVTTAPGWIDAYRRFVAGGWQSLTGSGLSPIIAHPDVKRMLMTMKALTHSARDRLSHGRCDRPLAPAKRQIAQEFLAGETLHSLAKRHDISRNLIRIWVKKLETGGI